MLGASVGKHSAEITSLKSNGIYHKTPIVLVPGVFHTPSHFEALSDALQAKGYPVERISHPTVGALAPTALVNADAANLRRSLESLINDQQKHVILLCHSYGGVPGSQSVVDLEAKARAKAGQKGGILKVIFLSALVPLEGESVGQLMAGAGIPPGQWLQPDEAFSIFHVNSKATETLYHDLAEDQAAHWVSKLEPMSAHFITAPATDVCWNSDVQKMYIFCKADRVFTRDEQQRMLERVQAHGKDLWEIYELKSGHSPFLSHVEELTEILAKESV
ncbi:AB hydrolase-1 domain-containing protein [Favolaschia claudopus]|uniref:AB hydrolase-1 domain-containing protein n=1 Tax=Favolaschia claudopus TaxID=2862362 RepID=A0AAW0A9S4_9AGAR